MEGMVDNDWGFVRTRGVVYEWIPGCRDAFLCAIAAEEGEGLTVPRRHLAHDELNTSTQT